MPSPFELHREVNIGDIARVRELLADGADINRIDPSGYTPLMYALQSRAASVELVQTLLDRGAVVAETNRWERGINVAAVCLRGGDPLKLALILARGADVHYTREHGYDALMDAAISCGRDRNARLLETLKMLIDRGVALNGVSTYQESALRVLSRLGRFDAVRLLLEAGADEQQLAWTPLHRAVALGSIADVKALMEGGADLETVDWWGCTPWLISVKTGDLEKARHLIDRGANFTVTQRGDVSALELAIDGFHTPMLNWLIELGFNVDSSRGGCTTPLMSAVRAGNGEAADVLIAAGADVDRQTACGTALGDVHTREIALRLLNAGADPANLSLEGRRTILGLEAEPNALLFDATPEDFRAAPTARFGGHNPELVNHPFWRAMIRSGISAWAGSQLVGGAGEDSPVWCAQRFGQSLTLLPDGRVIQIGGEHEDYYDPDFCIYNDVFVHHADGQIDIFCYPEDIFQPTDFHTATLSGESIYIVGGLGYYGARRFGETPVYRLDINTLRIHPAESRGEPPGWISKHRSVLISAHEIRIWGGKISALVGGKEVYEDNSQTWIFDITSCHWRRE